MNKSNQNRFRDIISILTLIIAIIALLVTLIVNFYLTPYLTYEKTSYSLPAGESLYVVIVRNEGHKSADDVIIYINTKGQIENVIGQMELITGKFVYSEEYVSFSSKNSSFRGELPYLPSEMTYKLCLIVSEQKRDKSPEEILITHRDGRATECKQSCFIPFVIGLNLGVCSILVIILLYSLKKKQKKYSVK